MKFVQNELCANKRHLSNCSVESTLYISIVNVIEVNRIEKVSFNNVVVMVTLFLVDSSASKRLQFYSMNFKEPRMFYNEDQSDRTWLSCIKCYNGSKNLKVFTTSRLPISSRVVFFSSLQNKLNYLNSIKWTLKSIEWPTMNTNQIELDWVISNVNNGSKNLKVITTSPLPTSGRLFYFGNLGNNVNYSNSIQWTLKYLERATNRDESNRA